MSHVVSQQLPLGFRWPANITLDNFIIGDNQLLLDAVRYFLTQPDEQQLFIAGASQTGKSHLLMAACHAAEQQGISAAYLPMKSFVDQTPDMLQGLEQLELIVIDDVDACVGHKDWQIALFNLFNNARLAQHKMLFSATSGPAALSLELADLKSRLCWGLSYQLQPLNDEQKSLLLTQTADVRGMRINREVSHYLLTHYSRDIECLLAVVEQLDKASLAEQRKLTVPFVKKVLGLG